MIHDRRGFFLEHLHVVLQLSVTLLQKRMCHLSAQLSLKLQVEKSVATLQYHTEVQYNIITEYTMGSKCLRPLVKMLLFFIIINILLQIYYLYKNMGKNLTE